MSLCLRFETGHQSGFLNSLKNLMHWTFTTGLSLINNIHVFILQHRNIPYNLNSTVSVGVISMPYRIQPSVLPTRATSVRTPMRKRWWRRRRRKKKGRLIIGLPDSQPSFSCFSLPARPPDGDLGAVGDGGRLLCRAALGHHPGHPGGTAGAGPAHSAHVEGRRSRAQTLRRALWKP